MQVTRENKNMPLCLQFLNEIKFTALNNILKYFGPLLPVSDTAQK
jgi:hypothetical protein